MTSKPIDEKKYRPAEGEDLLRDFHTDLSVGDILQRARMRENLSLAEVALATRIRESYITAIEEGNLSVLPGRIYALGFIKTYAEYLGLDGEKIVQLLKRQSGKKIEHKPLASTLPVDEDFPLPSLKAIAIVIGMLAVGLGTQSAYVTTTGLSQTIPGVPKDLKEQVTLLTRPQAKAPEVSADTSAASVPDGAPAAAEQPAVAEQIAHAIVLKASSPVWMEIRNGDKKTIFSRVISPGEEYWVPEDQQGLVMTVGNAGGLIISVEGKDIPSLGRKGQVLRAMPLNLDYLKDLLKKTTKQSM